MQIPRDEQKFILMLLCAASIANVIACFLIVLSLWLPNGRLMFIRHGDIAPATFEQRWPSFATYNSQRAR